MNPLISVIIPTYNEEMDIGSCLESLRSQTYKNFEVIVIDDGSTDNTIKILRKFKKIKIIKGKHRGTGFSRNLGAKQARGDILIFVDADMTFDKNYIKHLIFPILKNKNMVGTTHDYEIAVNIDKWVSKLWGKLRVDKRRAKYVKIFRAIKKDKFLEMGGFDPKYGYADDQTFWYKYRIKPIVAKDTICYHKNPETLGATFKQARWIGTSWRERNILFRIPLLNNLVSVVFLILTPVLAFVKTILDRRESFYKTYVYYQCKLYGYSLGLIKSVYLKTFEK